jgi:hypothetical protein
MVNGWVITTCLGLYGTNYMKRAVVAAFGWPANRQEDAVSWPPPGYAGVRRFALKHVDFSARRGKR